jgi:hypothetical protein
MMKSLLLMFLLTSVVGINVAQQSAKPDPTKLVGSWKVDLRPKPDAPAYFQKFAVKKVEGDTFTGTFYGVEIKEGRINRDWETIHFAFVTQDGTGVYNHSGKLIGERLEGTTNSVGRKFLSVWRADREK